MADDLHFEGYIETYLGRRCRNMHIIWMLIIGLIVGAIAKLIMPGRDPGGIFVSVTLPNGQTLVAGAAPSNVNEQK